ncbi:hypothetical protein EV700_3117 [Fluviicoccus keumensis]|uniref:Uncharacterized protein n=1 Tax=Fluviicoccus keumensis TaxID=1435465 RepID=A0A4Q7YJ99_9GAMM|nr:hypothetical protein [Fluviicoccus keumensis]RZU36904.1 hypothetical protein EV700_3117 [Fluviicoccus keumensis]
MSTARMTKQQWIELFQATGLSDAMMHTWHREFERRYPDQHQSFLEWIGLPAEEILTVRQFSQAG